MKTILIATALTLASAGALALDKVIDPNENYQSPLADHGPAPKGDKLGPEHGHGDDTIKDFVKHGHDVPVKDMPKHAHGPKQHQHGDDVVKDYVKHKDN